MNEPYYQCCAMIQFDVKCLNQPGPFINTHSGGAGQADVEVTAEWRFDSLNLSLNLDLHEADGACHHPARAGRTGSQHCLLGKRLNTARSPAKTMPRRISERCVNFQGFPCCFSK